MNPVWGSLLAPKYFSSTTFTNSHIRKVRFSSEKHCLLPLSWDTPKTLTIPSGTSCSDIVLALFVCRVPCDYARRTINVCRNFHRYIESRKKIVEMKKTSVKTKLTILFVCLIVYWVAYYYSSKNWMLQASLFPKHVHGKRTNKSFLYYVQTASCLFEYWLQPDLLGNGSLCDCDVLVLSYKTECLQNNLTHIRYIFSNRTTWTTGRNLLYRRAKMVMDNYNQYTYNTFMDEDMLWNWTEWPHFDDNINRSNSSPMRAYEQFLLRNLPVYGSPFYVQTTGSCKSSMKYGFEQLMRKYACGSRCAQLNRTSPASCLAITPDAAVASFHRHVIDNLLPYNEQYEAKSWWVSQQIMYVRLYTRFQKQSLTFLPVTICNPSHTTNYPRGMIPYQEIVDAEKLLSPLSKRNLSIWFEAHSVFNKGRSVPTCHHMLDPNIIRIQNSRMEMYIMDSVNAKH